MFIQQIGLVSETNAVDVSAVATVAAALQRQVARDFAPIWGVNATVDGFPRLEDVPPGYWPIVIMDDIGFDAAGIHLDQNGQPFALVQTSDSWSLTASHEALEMLADPFGNRLVPAQSIMPGQGRVEYLVEVCDPSEAEDFAYTSNGILVSDFYTPHYFDPTRNCGVVYSFTGAITEPRQVLPGGYLSWHDPITDHWFQGIFFGQDLEFRDLGVFSGSSSLRAWIDHITKAPRPEKSSERTILTAASSRRRGVEAASVGHCERLREQIRAIKNG